MHTTPWSSQFMKLYKEKLANETPLMQLSVGQSHTIACTGRGSLYVWGWNDNGQCAKDPFLVDEVIIKNTKAAQVDLMKFSRKQALPDEQEKPVRAR